ncbi:glycosyltransferase [Alcanivorax jadensis]|uniref:glycosyltransferase n=1 Tax=Alcanivorax jadensis TaxID=64988 RepID=UPI0024090D6C|nr:glycosyltransferase [Alcanivorax jadensis]MDF1637579.1 glycosyltransferase [Alcanivorax jadensis]
MILYITRNGLLEPLGQSQVFSYLKGLSQKYAVSLITFEKPEDTADVVTFQRVEGECRDHDIRWMPQRFHYRPKIIAPAWSMIVFLFLCLREVKQGKVSIIHARSYIPAAVALVVYKLTGTPFIFDMRALWPEELITAGRLKRGGMIHRILVRIERACLMHAAAVVSLTDAAVAYLKKTYPEELQSQRIAVIPTCADLDRFVPADQDSDEKVFSCVGTVLSGWFLIDWLAAFFHVVASTDPDARFEIITRDDPDVVRQKLSGDSVFQARLKVYGLPSDQVHAAVQQHYASTMFFTPGVSKLGSSPTRMAEILGCGLPVVANDGVGDVAAIVQRYQVGVVIEGNSQADMEKAYFSLMELIKDPELPLRCRKAAEEFFSLESGTRAYDQLYQDILGERAA